MAEWASEFDRYSIRYPFDGGLKAIKIDEEDVDEVLLEACVEQFIISEVADGYYLTHENLEAHLEVIKEHGMEAYLKKRLEVATDD